STAAIWTLVLRSIVLLPSSETVIIPAMMRKPRICSCPLVLPQVRESSGSRSTPRARGARCPGRQTRQDESSSGVSPTCAPFLPRARSVVPVPFHDADDADRGGSCSPLAIALTRGYRPRLHHVGDLLDLAIHEEHVGQHDLLAQVGDVDDQVPRTQPQDPV